MRLWSIHPKYLDCKGLVALWREGLLAQKVLAGETKGYRNHPQLERFKNHSDPMMAIASYLNCVYEESKKRKYCFRKERILPQTEDVKTEKIRVTKGQLLFEFEHLKRKLKMRDSLRYNALFRVEEIEPHPLFEIVNGGVENWERTN